MQQTRLVRCELFLGALVLVSFVDEDDSFFDGVQRPVNVNTSLKMGRSRPSTSGLPTPRTHQLVFRKLSIDSSRPTRKTTILGRKISWLMHL